MSWKTLPLAELVSIKGGGTPSRSKKEYWGGDIPWVTVKDFKSKKLSTAQESITPLGVDESATNIIAPNSIIVPTRMALGKVAINSVEIAINQDLKALLIKNSSQVDLGYLAKFLESQASNIEKQGKGATVKGITLDVLRNLEIPLPPLPVQKHIAAVLEKADTLRQQCQQMETELNTLAQSVFLDMFGDPVTNPKGWDKKKIKELVDEFQGGKSLAASENEHDSGINRVLKISAVTLGNFNPSESKPLPNSYNPPKEHFVKQGDLLFSRANTTELVGATSLVFETPENVLLPDKLWRFIWREEYEISQIFYWQLLSMPAMRIELGKISSGSGGSMKNISKAKLNELEVIYPPIKSQRHFEEIYLALRDQKYRLATKTLNANNLFSSVMQKAFKGELNLSNVA